MRIVSSLLLAWILFGFLFGLDYTVDTGCIPIYEPRFGLKSILFTSISCVLIIASIFIKKRNLTTVLLLIELVSWVAKLLFIKGGYAIGFGGDPSFMIVLYDLLAVFFRLLLLRSILDVKITILTLIIGLSILVIAVKILFFAMPNFYLYKASSDKFLQKMENR